MDDELEIRCITCSDEALPATVLRVEEETGLAWVQLEHGQVEVDISLVDEARPGDMLLVHGGVGLANLGNASQSG